MITVNRGCFLNKTNTKPLFKEKLEILGLGEANLSYSFCNKTGLIYQSQSLSTKDLNNYYSNLHLSLDNKSKPTLEKKKNLDRYLYLIRQECDKIPESVLEVSLMNLFTLKKFQFLGSKILHGIEPNLKHIKEKFNDIKIFKNNFENFRTKQKYDLIILAHVLEHLPDPQKAIKNCYKHQEKGQKILVEVPLFDRIKNYPLAGFTMEHLHYFSEDNMKYFLEKNGYMILSLLKTYNSTQMPFLTIVAEKSKKIKPKNISSLSVKIQKNNFLNYLALTKKRYKLIRNELHKINNKLPTYLYGAGATSSNFIFHSQIHQKINIQGIFDNNKDKYGLAIGNKKILDFDKFHKIKKNIIVTSEFSSDQIVKKINSKKNIIYVYNKNCGLKKIS